MSMLRVLGVLMFAGSLWAQSFSATPLNDLGNGTYLGFEGGLYENGSNVVPADHNEAGADLLPLVTPINGKIVFLGIGMSNATDEFSAFVQLANSDPAVNHSTLEIID